MYTLSHTNVPLYNFFDNYLIFRQSQNKIIINKRAIPSFDVPSDTEFTLQSNSEYTGPERIPIRSVKEASALLKNTSSCYKDITLISFEGVLVQRKFLEPLSSATDKDSLRIKVFGTPGKKYIP